MKLSKRQIKEADRVGGVSNNFHACFYLTRSTMTAELDGYSLAGWEFVAWVDTEWDTSERRAALFRRPSGTT